jgi:3'(2'), 5'-bisphosphate nucleotidase
MYSTDIDLSKINLEELLSISISAGEAIMDIYRAPFDVIEKTDGSPLTLADQISNKIINEYLVEKYPIPILSEENDSIAYDIRKNWNQYWLIDPLDGTKEFVHKRREFTVNIALMVENQPILGIIYAPVFKEMFYAVKGHGAFLSYKNTKTKLHSRSNSIFADKKFINPNNKHLKVILSRSHNEGFQLDEYLEPSDYSVQTIAMGSSLKFCRIAQGKVDINIRTKPTMEWDISAAQIILEEAGRKIVQFEDGKAIQYNKEDLTNPHFVAY